MPKKSNKQSNISHTEFDTQSSPLPAPPPSPRFIVANILPKQEIHLFGGPSHSGKTTLLLQIIDAWRQGKDVFGHPSHPAPFVYMSCSRSSQSVQSTLKRLGIAPDSFPLVSTVDDGECKTFDQAYAIAKKVERNLEVLFLDGIHYICPGKENNLKDVSEFLSYVTRRLQETEITLVGVGHSSKVKGDERFSNPRERFLGSSAWGTASSTMILVERDRPDDLQNNKRKVLVMPSNAPDQVLDYSLDSNGMFQPDIGDISQYDAFVELLFLRDPGTELMTRDIMDVAAAIGDQGINPRTTERYIRTLVENGRLEKTKWGKYRIPLLN